MLDAPDPAIQCITGAAHVVERLVTRSAANGGRLRAAASKMARTALHSVVSGRVAKSDIALATEEKVARHEEVHCRSVVPASPLTPYTLERAGQLADKAAFIDGATGRTMTYGEFEDAVRRQAGGWLERGLAKGEVVAVMAPNCPEYGVVFHAVALAGGVITTVNPTYTSGEVHHQLVDSGATRLVTIPMFLETATAAIADSAVKEVYVIGEADGYTSIASLARRAARGAGAGRSRRRRRAAVLVGHDRAWRRA